MMRLIRAIPFTKAKPSFDDIILNFPSSPPTLHHPEGSEDGNKGRQGGVVYGCAAHRVRRLLVCLGDGVQFYVKGR